MKLTVQEQIELTNAMNTLSEKSYKKGFEHAKEEELPNNFFEALIEYGKKTKTLIDYNRGKGSNWIQIKPTRDGSKGIKAVDIAFEDDLMNINHIGIDK